MTEELTREHLIQLLERLGGEEDADVLAAAREANTLVGDAGLSWDDILVIGTESEAEEAEAETEDEGEDEDEDQTGDDSDAEMVDSGGEENVQVLKLIEGLLAKKDISDDLRDELSGYKEDIAEGEFEAMDRKYVRALHARLTKRR
jgi:hypothetical protein